MIVFLFQLKIRKESILINMTITMDYVHHYRFFSLTIVNPIFVKINGLIKFLNSRINGYNSI